MRHRFSFLALVILLILLFASTSVSALSTHNNNWAVIVSTSRYWFNYRHTANALSMYHSVKQMGIPDSQIILMLPDDYACNPRNPFTSQMFPSQSRELNIYSRDLEVDYRGTEVTVASFLRLLTGRHTSEATPRSKRLLTNADSNIFIYMSGHGGNNFLKFQDNEEMNAQDIRDALQQMHAQQRYNSILFMVDTCQAATLFWELNQKDTPNIITIGSSLIKESSYSVRNKHILQKLRNSARHSNDTTLTLFQFFLCCALFVALFQYTHDYTMGLSLSDRFTFFTLHFFELNKVISDHKQISQRTRLNSMSVAESLSKRSVSDLFTSYQFERLLSHVEYRSDLLLPTLRLGDPGDDPLKTIPLTDYFGAVTQIERRDTTGAQAYPLVDTTQQNQLLGKQAQVGSAAASQLDQRPDWTLMKSHQNVKVNTPLQASRWFVTCASIGGLVFGLFALLF